MAACYHHPRVLQDSRKIRRVGAEELLTYALKLVGGRALSVGEVKTRLNRRAANPDDVLAVIAKLREYGYVNDSQFAEGFATARRDSGAFGKARVLRDLRQRQVASPVAQKAVEQAYEHVDETTAIEQWLERKLRNVRLAEYLQDEKHLASAYRKLRYAGFSSSASIRVLKRYADRADELEDAEPEA